MRESGYFLHSHPACDINFQIHGHVTLVFRWAWLARRVSTPSYAKLHVTISWPITVVYRSWSYNNIFCF